MDEELPLNDDDVVFLETSYNPLGTSTSKVGEIKHLLRSASLKNVIMASREVQGEVLRAKSALGWRRGKLKLRLDIVFVPDEPDESESEEINLDEILNS